MRRTRLKRKTPLRNKALERFLRRGNAAAEAFGLQMPGKKAPTARAIARAAMLSEEDALQEWLDKACSWLCKQMCQWRCERCRSTLIVQWHHVFTRGYWPLRWEPRNWLCLCRSCHDWWHNRSQGGEQWVWFVTVYGAERYDYLNLRYKLKLKKRTVDLKLQKLFIESEVRRHGWQLPSEM